MGAGQTLLSHCYSHVLAHAVMMHCQRTDRKCAFLAILAKVGVKLSSLVYRKHQCWYADLALRPHIWSFPGLHVSNPSGGMSQ